MSSKSERSQQYTLRHVPYNKNIMKALTSYVFFQGTSKDKGTSYGIMSEKKSGCKKFHM